MAGEYRPRCQHVINDSVCNMGYSKPSCSKWQEHLLTFSAHCILHSLPNGKMLDLSKLKAFADYTKCGFNDKIVFDIVDIVFPTILKLSNNLFLRAVNPGEKEKLLVTSNFSFSPNVFHSYISYVCQNAALLIKLLICRLNI